MLNPFFGTVAERISDVTKVRIDRDHELEVCSDALVKRRQNVLLYGTRGAGKTFLLRLVERRVQDLDSAVYPCVVNVASVGAYALGDEAAGFPRAILLQFCTDLWTKILGDSYLDLRSTLDESGQEIKFPSVASRSIQRVYRHLMTRERELHNSVMNAVGFAAGLKGEKKEENVRSGHQADVLPFEFAEFTHELVSNVLTPRGKRDVIFLCDEANHMPLFKQEQVLERYLELFSARRVQFLFVAGLLSSEANPYLPSCFETQVELKGFPEKRFVRELINCAVHSAGADCPTFGDEVVEIIYENYQGHPRLTLDACSHAYEDAIASGKREVTVSMIVRVCREMDERQRLRLSQFPKKSDS